MNSHTWTHTFLFQSTALSFVSTLHFSAGCRNSWPSLCVWGWLVLQELFSPGGTWCYLSLSGLSVLRQLPGEVTHSNTAEPKHLFSAFLEASWVFTWFLPCVVHLEALLLGCFPPTQLLSSFLRFSSLLEGNVSVHSLKQNCKWVFAYCGCLTRLAQGSSEHRDPNKIQLWKECKWPAWLFWDYFKMTKHFLFISYAFS